MTETENKLFTVYRKGDLLIRKVLEAEFGKEYFAIDIRERVKTLADALTLAEEFYPNIRVQLKEIEDLKNPYVKRMVAEFKLMVIADVLNQGWKPDWTNTNQRKWYPWFTIVGGSANSGAYAGFGYVCSHDGASCTYTHVGSRLCFSSQELAEHAGRTFLNLYRDFLLG